jgi:hypothetical protein
MHELGPVGAHPFLAAEEAAQDQRARSDQFAKSERNHGECGAGAARRDRPENDAERKTAERPDDRDEKQRHRQPVMDHGIHGVDRQKSAQAVIDGVTKRQQAGLAKQHVVGQREHDHDAHEAEHGERAAGRED